MCSKHVEAWNKLIIKFSASSWLILINKFIEIVRLFRNEICLTVDRGLWQSIYGKTALKMKKNNILSFVGYHYHSQSDVKSSIAAGCWYYYDLQHVVKYRSVTSVYKGRIPKTVLTPRVTWNIVYGWESGVLFNNWEMRIIKKVSIYRVFHDFRT